MNLNENFGLWLSQYDGKDPTVKDLKKDFIMMRGLFPKQGEIEDFKTPETVYADIARMNGCSGAITALKNAAIEYGQPLNE